MKRAKEVELLEIVSLFEESEEQVENYRMFLQQISEENEALLTSIRAILEANKLQVSRVVPVQKKLPDVVIQKSERGRLSDAIRVMARQRPGHEIPGEEKNVDLLKYLHMELDSKCPMDIKLEKFLCMGYIEKLSGKQWQKRYFIFDLKKKLLSWFKDNRPQASAQGCLALVDVMEVFFLLRI